MKKKFYMDTQFHEYKKDDRDTIELISIGIVDEDGREYYAICNEFNIDAAWDNEWLRDNVLSTLFPQGEKMNPTLEMFKQQIYNHGKTKLTIASETQLFCAGETIVNERKSILNEIPDTNYNKEELEISVYNIQTTDEYEFYAYYGDYDWVVFCWLFGRMIDLPKGFPMYCKDLKQVLDETADRLAHRISNTQANGLTFDNIKFIKSLSNYPTQDNAHNALDDAKWNKDLHDFLNKLI